MAWTNSKGFGQFFEDALENTAAFDLSSTTAGQFKAALYNDTITPDETVNATNSAYAVGQWVVGGEVDDGTNWDTGGEPLTSVTHVASGLTGSRVLTWDAADTPQGGASTTLAAVFGCLVYDEIIASPVANQGICYNYFGGTQDVTAGNFTIVWNVNGIVRLSF
jgi:hypothetical protein